MRAWYEYIDGVLSWTELPRFTNDTAADGACLLTRRMCAWHRLDSKSDATQQIYSVFEPPLHILSASSLKYFVVFFVIKLQRVS